MCIDVCRGGEGTVTQPDLDLLHGDTVAEKQAGAGVTKIMGAIDAGYVSQNICLACTALGLATVPRMTMDKETLAKELYLDENKTLLVNHPVGYEK